MGLAFLKARGERSKEQRDKGDSVELLSSLNKAIIETRHTEPTTVSDNQPWSQLSHHLGPGSTKGKFCVLWKTLATATALPGLPSGTLCSSGHSPLQQPQTHVATGHLICFEATVRLRSCI